MTVKPFTLFLAWSSAMLAIALTKQYGLIVPFVFGACAAGVVMWVWWETRNNA